MDGGARPDRPTVELSTHPGLDRAGLRLVPAARTARGPAGSVSLEPRVMQLLLALADADGDVVPRDGLLRACWGPAVVGDDALNRAVAGARRALREVGAEGWALETIPRVGYRLRAPDALPSPQTSVAPANRRRVAVAGLALAGAATGLGLALWPRAQAPARSPALALAMQQAEDALRLASPEGDRQAVDTLDQALQGGAAGDASAWGLLARARRLLAEAAEPPQLPAALAATTEAADRALARDPRQPDALWVRATLLPPFGRWAQAEAALREVLVVAPDHLPTLDSLAFLLAGTGIIAGHYALRQRTVTGDPLHAGYNFRSIYSHWMNGALAAADQAGERGLELWPHHLPTWAAWAALLAYTGRAARALALLEGAPGLPPPMVTSLRLTWTALASGQARDRALAREAALQGLERAGPVRAVGATMDLAALGETELALDVSEAFLLDRGSLRTGTAWQPGLPWHLDLRRRFANHLFLPVCAPLHRHPRFAALMQDVGLAAHWARTGRPPDHLGRR